MGTFSYREFILTYVLGHAKVRKMKQDEDLFDEKAFEPCCSKNETPSIFEVCLKIIKGSCFVFLSCFLWLENIGIL